MPLNVGRTAMKGRRPRIAAGLALGVCVLVAASCAEAPPPPVEDELAPLRQARLLARQAADSCADVLADVEERFRLAELGIDSLKAAVDGFQTLEGGQVPGERYAEYRDALDAYNEAVPARNELADTLQSQDAACRALVTRHNELTDSLRRRLEDLGLAADTVGRP